MTNQTLEFELSMGASGIVCNASQLLQELPTMLKSYSYVVDETNQGQAKTDRTKLNNMVNLIKEQRQKFENDEIGQWLSIKKDIMSIEKTFKQYADALGDGIKAVDEQTANKKKENIKMRFEAYALEKGLDNRITFEYLYDDKEYSKKTMTENKIVKALEEKINGILNDLKFIATLLDGGDRAVLEDYYFKTHDLITAKAKYDDFKAQQERQQAMQSQVATQQVAPAQQVVPIQRTVQPTLDSTVQIQEVTASMEASNEYFVELFQLVNAHGVKMEISSMNLTLEAPTPFFNEIKKLKAKYNARTQITSAKKKGE